MGSKVNANVNGVDGFVPKPGIHQPRNPTSRRRSNSHKKYTPIQKRDLKSPRNVRRILKVTQSPGGNDEPGSD